MTTSNHSGENSGGAADRAFEEIDALWEEFEENLAAYLATMTDPDEEDHLRIELPDPDPLGETGCPPYAQFAGFGDGAMVHAEISGNAYLLPQYQLDKFGCEFLRRSGWCGNVTDADPGSDECNWVMERPIEGDENVGVIANLVMWVLRHSFGIAHPHLLTYAAWGPAADGAAALGLSATEEIPVEEPLDQMQASDATPTSMVVDPADRTELVAAVVRVLEEKYGGELFLDDDEDIGRHHLDQLVWVRVRQEQPAVEIFARVAHNVRSRRATAVEIGLLNRDNLWVRWTLRERAVWQTLILPGLPFVPSHLDAMLDIFLQVMSDTRDDLALRTGARVG